MTDTARSPWLLTTWAAGLVAVASIALAGAWDGWLPVVLMLVAAIVPMVLLRLAVGLGVSRWAATSVLVLLLVLTAYLMATRSGTTLAGTVTDAVPLLLTSPQPYALRADLLVPPILFTGLVSLLAGLRAERRTRVGPVAGAAALYVAGALLTTGRSDPWGLLAVLVVVLALLGWVLLDEHGEPTRRRVVLVAPALVVVSGALAAAALVPSTDPFDARSVVDPPITVVETPSPLPQLGAWAANPDAELLRVAGDAVPLRLVTLDSYDGTQWRAATRYSPLGTSTDEPLTGEQRRTSTVRVAFAGLGGHWLPSPGDPTEVSEPDAVVDTVTGTLYDPSTSDDTAYDVTGVVDLPDPDRLVGATVPTSGPALDYTRLPSQGLPPALAEYAARVIPAGAPYQQALAIEAAVRADRRLSPRAISGSAFWRIERFLVGRGTGAQTGTSEQFATAFALLARHAGLPTRIVVGFRPGDRQPDGTRVIRGRDALAWPEVYFDRLGWVPFSPTPNDDTFSEGRPELGEAPDVDRSPSSASPEPTPEPVVEAASEPRLGTARDRLDVPPWLAATVVLPVVALVGARQARSIRHRRRGAKGAWAEVHDALVLAGVPPRPSESAQTAAARADRRFGTNAAWMVAERAERDAFGPGIPVVTPRAQLREVRRAARRSVPLWRRWWWWLDPRVFRSRRSTRDRQAA